MPHLFQQFGIKPWLHKEMVEAAGVEPTLVLTATRVCSGLPNVYRISVDLRSSFLAFNRQFLVLASDICVETRTWLTMLKLHCAALNNATTHSPAHASSKPAFRLETASPIDGNKHQAVSSFPGHIMSAPASPAQR